MKKYHQLLLFIISLVSLTLFLIYRHEYNRLHYVLEVFNFFGQPCNISTLQQTEDILSHHDWGPQPNWQEHETGYVFSAFLTTKNEARALNLQSNDKLVPRTCYFWMEDKKKPLIGKFKYSKIINDDNTPLNLYFYICTSSNNDHIPYAVSFSYKNRKDNELKKIMLTNSLSHKMSFNSTICISPSIYSKRRLVEFLAYHKLIGIDSFIFYNRDVPHRLVKIISNLSTRLALHTTFYPWNYPKIESAITRNIIENDCLLRTFAQSKFSATLELNEYIVPTQFYGFDAMLQNFEGNAQRFSLPVQKFCIEASDTSRPISVSNLDIADDSSFNQVRYIYRNDERKEEVDTLAVGPGFGSIHKYVKCTVKSGKMRREASILRYGTDLTRSTLFQLLLHNQI